MLRRTDSSPIVIQQARPAPSPRRGEGWGEGERARERPRGRMMGGAAAIRVRSPHPTLSRWERALGARQAEGAGDLFEDACHVFRHVVVPEAEDRVAVCLDQAGALDVGGVSYVLAAVEFDHQPRSTAGEVRYVWPDRKLAHELGALDLSRPQSLPQRRLHLGRAASQLARDGRKALLRRAIPSPNSLPMGEGFQVPL